MKQISFAFAAALMLFASCGNSGKNNAEAANDSTAVSTDSAATGYKVADKANVDISKFPVDKDGYIVLFDGKTLNGWRGYGMDNPPKSWEVQDGAIHLKGSGTGEAHAEDGGKEVYLPIWQSSSEYQVLDNENHIDAKLGKDGNRQSASLYDMLPAKPQNAKPYGQWNKAKIMVFKGTVIHGQNGENVVEYHLWTPKWTEMLQASKFKEGGEFPYAFELLNNMGGEKHEGYIGLQDHGDDVWYRNIRIKILD